MAAERRSSAPDFSVGDTVFQCWIIGEGGAAHYEWRTLPKGRIRVRRIPGRFSHWAAWRDGKRLPGEFERLGDAMRSAVA